MHLKDDLRWRQHLSEKRNLILIANRAFCLYGAFDFDLLMSHNPKIPILLIFLENNVTVCIFFADNGTMRGYKFNHLAINLTNAMAAEAGVNPALSATKVVEFMPKHV